MTVYCCCTKRTVKTTDDFTLENALQTFPFQKRAGSRGFLIIFCSIFLFSFISLSPLSLKHLFQVDNEKLKEKLINLERNIENYKTMLGHEKRTYKQKCYDHELLEKKLYQHQGKIATSIVFLYLHVYIIYFIVPRV